MGDCALDLCCGSGDLAFLLSEKVGSNGKVIDLDFSKEQLSIASCRQGLAPNACYNNIEAKMGDCALDLCCGSGDLAFLLSEKVGSNGKVIGLDFSKEQLSIASCRQGLAPNACYNNIEWVEGDALELPFSDGYFDAITMGYGLRNVVDKERAMQEMFRVLKPGLTISISLKKNI
nr:2-phytyl-1,4-beta-naphthoquinone methyltransferase, chloroplastic [Quercus suber]